MLTPFFLARHWWLADREASPNWWAFIVLVKATISTEGRQCDQERKPTGTLSRPVTAVKVYPLITLQSLELLCSPAVPCFLQPFHGCRGTAVSQSLKGYCPWRSFRDWNQMTLPQFSVSLASIKQTGLPYPLTFKIAPFCVPGPLCHLRYSWDLLEISLTPCGLGE